jgi:methyl-accepting chemotaxis protein/methyl-accepting chemotaxis protein-1 (serine sensor receptor)
MRNGRKLNSLSDMLSIRVSLGILAIALISLSVAAVIFEASARQQARAQVDEVAADTAAKVVGAFDHPMGVVFGMTAAIEAAREEGLLDRGYHERILRKTLLSNPELLGTWTAWEPNAFDGKDAQFTHAPAHDATGRFIPYWHRSLDGRSIALRELRDFNTPLMNDFYTRPLRERKPVLIEPAVDSETRNVLVTSIAIPVLKNGRVIGVVAGDLELTDLQAYINRIKVPFEGRIAILSTDRLYVYNVDRRLLGKPAPPSKSGMSIQQDAQLGTVMHVERPIDFPGIDAHWVVQLDLPVANALAGPRRVEMMLLVSVLAFAMALAWHVRRTAHRVVGEPLEAIRTEMVALAAGDLASTLLPAPRSRDLAQMQAALQVFRDNARAKQAVEEEQARAIAALGLSLEKIAHGDLTASLEGQFDGAFGKLQGDFNTAMLRVSAAFEAVSTSTQTVSAGAGDIHASSQDLAQRTERQAASLTQMTRAIADITGQAQQSTTSASQANQVVCRFREEIQDGGAVIRQAIESMNAIERSSAEIADIVGVIEGIAFQTNLLALNAGVEAARAGEAGRGFAVVASEVRALAARSSQAAYDVRARIGANIGQVQTGVGLVDKMDQALDRIVARIGEISELVVAISEASQQQLVSVTAVNTSVHHMDSFMQQNAAVVEQSAASARSLSELVKDLNGQVDQFRFHAGHPSRWGMAA